MILEGLNKQQREAAETMNGNIVIIAGAGSGKTRTITYRIAHMVKECGIDPNSILALTFTNKAANEMKERIEKLVGEDTPVSATTFHSFAYKFLKKFPNKIGYKKNFTIADDEDQREIIKKIIKNIPNLYEILDTKRVKKLINKAKETGHYTKKEAQNYYKKMYEAMGESVINQLCDIFEEYNKTLKDNNTMDFSDLIINLKNILLVPGILEMVQKRFKYFIVDEYQDTNLTQGQIVDLMSSKEGNLCVVGDPDQSIYKFRGAQISIINDFAKNHRNTKIIKLEENYRSTPQILEAANVVIANNPQNYDKKLWTSKGNGDKIRLISLDSEEEEGKYIADTIMENVEKGKYGYKDFTVLYRANFQSRAIEQKLLKAKIPYRIFGGIEFFQRKEIKDVLSFLKVFVNPYDEISFIRICKCMKIGIGDKAVEKIESFAKKNNLDFVEVLKYSKSIKGITQKAKDFLWKCNELFEEAKQFDETPGEILEFFYNRSGYSDFLDDDEEWERKDNVNELISSFATAFREEPDLSFEEYLNEVAMYSSADKTENDDNFVSLMTVHKSKGLEFSYVFITGVEEGLFPMKTKGYGPISENSDMEEERRLFYVAMTRAMNKLEITGSRNRHGNETNLSTFVKEMDGIDYEMEYKEKDNDFWNMRF
jgi:Superfamily I DNA and RNA helicases